MRPRSLGLVYIAVTATDEPAAGASLLPRKYLLPLWQAGIVPRVFREKVRIGFVEVLLLLPRHALFVNLRHPFPINAKLLPLTNLLHGQLLSIRQLFISFVLREKAYRMGRERAFNVCLTLSLS